MRYFKFIALIIPFVIMGCGDKPQANKPLPVGFICNAGSFAPRAKALEAVFDVLLKQNQYAAAMQLQRLTEEIREVCTIAESNRSQIFHASGARLDSTRTRFLLDSVKDARSLSKSLESWARDTLTITTPYPVHVGAIPDSVKVRFIRSGVILLTDGFIKFDSLTLE